MAIAVTALAMFPALGEVALMLAAALVLVAVYRAEWRDALMSAANGVVWGAILALAFHLMADNFQLRYAWIYSGSELPLHLKLANIWGGDEGTTLLLAAILTSLAGRYHARMGSSQVTAWLAVWYLAFAAYLTPFAATSVDWLAEKASQGMNAHLMNFWMLLHAPLIFLAYGWVLSLAAPSLDALSGREMRWPAHGLTDARRAWALLTAGIGFGMVWAFEDSMYGQFWHWDPVQTSIFVIWCALSAHLHGVRGWSTSTRTWRWVPLWALMAAIFTAVTMAVTRNEVLASSHRYAGSTSWIAHCFVIFAILCAGGYAWWQGRAIDQPSTARQRQTSVNALALRVTQLCFVSLGLCAASYLAWAFTAEAFALPRPDHLRPFFETLTNWASGAEIPLLRSAFAQWDMDGYAAARLLVWPLACLGLLGGWFFMRRVSRPAAWVSLVAAVAVAAVVYSFGGPLTEGYRGTGVLSQSIVRLLPQLDVCLLAGAYLALSCAIWTGSRAWTTPSAASYLLPLGILHIGAVVSLWGGLIAMTLNSYSQHRIVVGNDWTRSHHGYQLRITDVPFSHGEDGGVRTQRVPYLATAHIELKAPGLPSTKGQALYRDSRTNIDNYDGPVRQICEILDYRYARYKAVPGYVLHPFIDRGWLADKQIWVNPSVLMSDPSRDAGSKEVVAILRIFPFASALWLGLALMASASLWLAFLSPGKSER